MLVVQYSLVCPSRDVILSSPVLRFFVLILVRFYPRSNAHLSQCWSLSVCCDMLINYNISTIYRVKQAREFLTPPRTSSNEPESTMVADSLVRGFLSSILACCGRRMIGWCLSIRINRSAQEGVACCSSSLKWSCHVCTESFEFHESNVFGHISINSSKGVI